MKGILLLGGLLLTSSFGLVYGWMNDWSGSCLGLCGMRNELGCNCDKECFVYKSCCPDIFQLCPGVHLAAQNSYSEELLNATSVCPENADYFLIQGCGEQTLGSLTHDVMSENSSPSLPKIPVFDNVTGILYENLESYQCFASEGSEPVLFNMYVWLGFVSEMNYESYVRAIGKSRYMFDLPASYNLSGHLCKSKMFVDPTFAMLVNLDTAKSARLEVRSSPSSGKYFHIECDPDRKNNSCSYKSCGEGGHLEDGICLYNIYMTFTFTHPRSHNLTISDLNTFAEYNFCSSALWMHETVETEIMHTTLREPTADVAALKLESILPFFTLQLRLASHYEEHIQHRMTSRVSDQAFCYLRLISGEECEPESLMAPLKGCLVLSKKPPSSTGMCSGPYLNTTTQYPVDEHCFNKTRINGRSNTDVFSSAVVESAQLLGMRGTVALVLLFCTMNRCVTSVG